MCAVVGLTQREIEIKKEGGREDVREHSGGRVSICVSLCLCLCVSMRVLGWAFRWESMLRDIQRKMSLTDRG